MVSRPKKGLLSALCLALLVLTANLLHAQPVAATATPPIPANAVPDPILEIRHESDLSGYNTLISHGDNLRQSAAAALAGTAGGLLAEIEDNTGVYGDVDFSTLTSSAYRFRFYVDPNNIAMGIGNSFLICRIMDGGVPRYWVNLAYRAGSYRLQLAIRQDNGAVTNLPEILVTDAAHHLQALIEFSAGPSTLDGKDPLWIDGTQVEQLTGVDLYDMGKPERMRLGAVFGVQSTTSGTLYVDEFILRDDSAYIGPLGSAANPQPGYNPNRAD